MMKLLGRGKEEVEVILPPPPTPSIVVAPSTLVQDLQSLFQNRKEFVDLIIDLSDGKSESAHRLICSARSKYFREKIIAATEEQKKFSTNSLEFYFTVFN